MRSRIFWGRRLLEHANNDHHWVLRTCRDWTWVQMATRLQGSSKVACAIINVLKFGFHGFMTAQQISEIWQVHADIKQWVSDQKREAANERARNYRAFVKGAVNEKGAQILHRITKIPALYLPTQVDIGNGQTTMDQANADHQRTIWKKVWNGQ